ncbi:DUF551 domain-containing protein [Klebsiella pneumoniae]
MTKSTITRERLEEIVSDPMINQGSEFAMMARMALVAMDSEPVAWTWQHLKEWYVTSDKRRAAFVAKDGDVAVLPLYRHAQPVPVVSADLLHTAASAIEDLLTTKDRTGACVWFDLPFRLRSAANAHSAPVVPDDVLAALQKVARICLDLNDFDGDRRGIADCLGDAEEALIEVVNRRAAMLAAAPHDTPALNSVQSVVTVPGKWIPVSERMPIEFEAVIAFDGDQVYGEAMYSSDDGFTIDGYEPCDRLNLQNVTHWMPLPAAPQEVKP